MGNSRFSILGRGVPPALAKENDHVIDHVSPRVLPHDLPPARRLWPAIARCGADQEASRLVRADQRYPGRRICPDIAFATALVVAVGGLNVKACAMDKVEWKRFFRFIDEGGEAALQQRKDALACAWRKVTNLGVRCDIRRMLRLIDEEVLIRQNLSSRKQARRSKRP
jgi:hypothetical protein